MGKVTNNTMGGIVEEMILEEKKKMALRMLKTGKISIEEAAGYLDLPPEIVEGFAKDEKSR